MHLQTRLTSLIGLALAVGFSLSAAEPADGISADGRRVTVRTPRYAVEFEGLTLTRIENRLTGEVYAQPLPTPPADSAKSGAPAGLAIESLRPAVPVKVYGLCEQTKVEPKKLDNGGLAMVYTGLQCGEAFDPKLSLALNLAVDPKTGDLLIRPEVRAEIEQVHGVRDRGVLHAALRFGPLAEDLRLIIPASDGFSVTKDNVGADWSYQARWPQVWEAALLVAESAKGCLGLWADEPELRYGRTLGIQRAAGWNVTLAFETADAIYRCTELKGATWRFNVFDGYWLRAADRYVQQMEQQWPDLQRFETGKPAWADKVRIFITGPTPDPATAKRYVDMVPRDSIAVFTCQEWLRGWNEGDILKLKKGMDYFPNWPLDNPEHYEARPDMPAKFKACEELGIHIFPYTNPTVVTWGHPWLEKIGGSRAFLGMRFWQRFHPEFCQDIVKRYGVSGIYEDCSWVVARNTLGEPDGDNWYNGSVHMRHYFRELLPEVAVTGERNNEVTMRGQKFALSITQWGEHAHPIGTRLFSPFLRMWNLQLGPAGFDADDIRGWLTPWPTSCEERPIQERLLLRKRGLIFAKEQLKSHWPETWDPAVMHYFKAADGTEFRFVRDRGTRFVKLGKGGEETLYWRLHGVAQADIKTGGVEGWVGYDGKRIVGLNPRATYVLLDDVKRPPVTLSAVPETVVVSRCVVRDDYWVATLAPAKPAGKGAKTAPEPSVQTLRVRASGGQTVAFGGAESAKKLGDSEWEVHVKVPGGLVAYWGEPAVLQHGEKLTAYPARNTIMRMDSGLLAGYGGNLENADAFTLRVGDVSAGEEGTIPWLVKVPEFGPNGEETAWLVFKIGSLHPHGDGADYFVRVNGQELWRRYHPEAGKPDPKKPDEPQPLPLSTGAVNLSPYAGQVIVLELAADGHGTSVSEVVRWHQPRLQVEAPNTAETDEKGPAPQL